MAKILIVDDNSSLLEITREFLLRSGHVAITAANGKQAVDLFTAQSFDLVITDLIMPEKEGIETIIELRRAHPTLKIIAMSGGGRRGADDYLALAQMLGASRTLLKPFSAEELLEAVADVLAGGTPAK